jgi:multidrug efflux pump subunit AcrB
MTVRGRAGIIAAGVLLLASGFVGAYFLFRCPDDKNRALQDQPAPAPPPAPVRAAPYQLPLVICVSATYPGANAQTVVDVVAAPIEQQVNGVENVLSMTSASANDGTYTLQITFSAGTDLDVAQVLVQNRVSLALPLLPQLVQNEGITVRKKAPQPIVLVSVTSPDDRFDSLYLSNYATIQIRDELARLPGVGDVIPFGRHDSQLRVTLDTNKLSSRNLTATDVLTALAQKNIQIEAGPIGQQPRPAGQQFQLTVGPLGRLPEPETLGDIIISTGPPGASAIVRLRDLARVERAKNEAVDATLDGKPAVLLGVQLLPSAKASQVSRAVVEKLTELRTRAPDGLDLAVAFDFSANLEEPDRPTAPDHLVIDAELPDGASTERTVQTLNRAAKVVRTAPGIRHVLTLTEHPFSLVRNQPCLIVGLAPRDQRDAHREPIAERLRGSLRQEIPEAAFRVSVPSTAAGFPVYGWPVEFAIEGSGDLGWERRRQSAQALIDRMIRSGKFVDVGGDPGSRGAAFLYMEIDRTKCQALGVAVNDVFNTLQVFLGSYYVNNFNTFGRTWQLSVRTDPNFRDRTDDLLKLQVKNKEGQAVRLGTIMTVRDAEGPAVIERHNLYPMVRITAALAAGVSMDEARALCETLADQELGKEMKLSWRP